MRGRFVGPRSVLWWAPVERRERPDRGCEPHKCAVVQSAARAEGDRVVVEAGATWSDVLRATLAQGKAPPVLTDYLELSVGGTLIVGGVGGTTSAFGARRATT